MQIVIDIPEKLYERFGHEYREENLISKSTNDAILEAFCNGTPLPKGHGRLIDADELDNKMKGGFYYSGLPYVPTIIEADKEYEAEVITRGNCMMCGKELSEGEGIFFCKECEDKVRDENNKRKKELENQLNISVQNIIEAESEEV